MVPHRELNQHHRGEETPGKGVVNRAKRGRDRLSVHSDELSQAKTPDSDRWSKECCNCRSGNQRQRCEQEEWVEQTGAESGDDTGFDPANLYRIDHYSVQTTQVVVC